MAYVIYEDAGRKRFNVPVARINANGRLILNAVAARLLRDKKARRVFVLFDLERGKLALAPITGADGRSYPVFYSKTDSYASVTVLGFLRSVDWNGQAQKLEEGTWNEEGAMLEFNMPARK